MELRDLHLARAGITVYLKELVSRLIQFDDLSIRGTVLRMGGLIHHFVEPADYEQFKIPLAETRLPEWIINEQPHSLKLRLVKCILTPFIPSYNFFVRDNESDVFLFLNSQAPSLPVRGKIITCLHDITPFRVPETFPPSYIDVFKGFFSNVLKNATKIITDSEFSKQDIIDYAHIDESRIEVVYCGVNAEEFAMPCPSPENVRAKYNLPEKYVLYFGTCGPRKNVESVVRAYARLPEATRHEYALVITNPSDAVKACAAENNVTPHYLSGVSTEDKPAVYQMASVLVWLSIYEGFGLPIVEAQAAGTPVVCSNVTSLPEVAGDAAVLVEPMDTEAAAAAIERCLYDAPFRQDLTARGRENIKRFSWDNAAEKLHDIIINL
ncbi:MAG: glycosyltransferase family 4 protein [Fretibacterium sp.]|nr:glycosyltransferase family 4 protein [Fretibacterium sp.]